MATLLNVSASAMAAVSADKVKVAYVYQLTKFVTWPNFSSESFNNSSSNASTNTSKNTSNKRSFRFCVLGDASINHLFFSLSRRTKTGVPIVVETLKTLDDLSQCHILYFSKTSAFSFEAVFRRVSALPILTVSSVPNFIKRGGIIGFVVSNNKVRLEINRESARQARIKLSAKLLEVATRVIDVAEELQP